ncbi:MAG: hypothetical protein B7Z55_01370 [Planctomycetales bacterium 12-60-4]|nr:MAG: hypothetical protein B7Z55_01370 [Planctomycetales bacterium 12-60-4]
MKPSTDTIATPKWVRWIAVGWVWLFLVIFVCQPLPNNGNVRRYEILPVLPFAVMDALDPPAEPGSLPRGLIYLGERLPLLGIALVIAVTAWSAGTLLLTWLPDLRLTSSEQCYFAMLVGLSLVSLLTLGLGLAGWLSAGVFWGMHAALIMGGALRLRVAAKQRIEHEYAMRTWRDWWWIAAPLPFVIGMTLGSLSPSTDFDVNEYHLGGPKEWYLAGSIHFLEHDIYTSFPFLTEMLLLDAMVLFGDWYWGGIAGQAVLMLFAPLTAFGIWTFGRRWFSPTAGVIGALVYLSTPWVFRMSIIAYAEGGLAAFVLGAMAAGFLAAHRLRAPSTGDEPAPVGPTVLTGLCAGSAMAAKYTGLVMAVAPWAVILLLLAWKHGRLSRSRTVLTTYLIGVALAVGPWILKNFCETGNPVYPLGYSVFGGRDLDDELADKWRHAHARPSAGSVVGEARDLLAKAFDVAAVNDWQSPLVFALAPLAFLWPTERQRIGLISGLLVWLFVVWWGLTHHLDRFWTPLLPLGAVLAGVGVASLGTQPWRSLVTIAVTAGVGFNLGFVSTGLVGYNAGLTKLSAAADLATRITGPEIAWLNEAMAQSLLPPKTKVLCVGEAELFHARFPYVYNTVFDRVIFEQWCGVAGTMPSAERPLKPAAEIRQILKQHGITHVFVNWGEILRYRQPYSYGYSDFVSPRTLATLVDRGVLHPPLKLPAGLGRQSISAPESDNAKLARTWAPELVAPCGTDQCLTTAEIFPVVP